MEEFERTCSRCSRDFKADKEHACVCPDCKAPVASRRRHALGAAWNPERGPLPPRLFQVAKLVAEGLANKEIAFRLHVTEGSVKEYMYTIFKKLGVSNRAELVRHVLLTPAVPERVAEGIEPAPRVFTPAAAFPVHLL